MERIVIVMDASQPAMHVMNFACRLAKAIRSGLTVLLIENVYSEPVPLIDELTGSYCCSGEVKTLVTADTEQTVRIIKDRCRKDRIAMELCVTRGEPITEVLFNSKFADMLVMDASLDFYKNPDGTPSHFVTEILKFSECPVLLAPLEEYEINQIDFFYDSTASSVFAIKQFTYLLPGFCDKNVALVEVKENGHHKLERTERRMMDWLRTHYREADYVQLQGNPAHALFDYLFLKTNRIVVIGSYGRSMLSQFFKRSTAERLIKAIDLPIFVTHH